MVRKEVYFKVKKLLEEKHQKERVNLATRFAKKNRKYRIGQIIKGPNSTIKIDKIEFGVFFGSELPEPIYYGYVLKKDLSPRKDSSRDSIFQGRIIEVIE